MGDHITRNVNDYPFGTNGQSDTILDAGDIWVKRTAYEKTDMTVNTTERLVEEWINDDGDIKYKEIQLSYNAAGEIIKSEVLGYTDAVPSWASTILA